MPLTLCCFISVPTIARPVEPGEREKAPPSLRQRNSRNLSYREVKSPHLLDVLNDENWPDELRIHRGRLRRSDGVPLWLVISDHEIVELRFGATEWRASILPKIKSLLR